METGFSGNRPGAARRLAWQSTRDSSIFVAEPVCDGLQRRADRCIDTSVWGDLPLREDYAPGKANVMIDQALVIDELEHYIRGV